MKSFKHLLVTLLLLLLASSCIPAGQEPIEETETPISITPSAFNAPPRSCKPTFDDGVSPSYKPDASQRTVVGSGHVVTGTVLSSVDCQPIANARLEFWPEETGLGHPDSSRATFFTDENGRYRFECNLPEHIHMRISAEGFQTIGVNSYHPNGAAEGIFDIVLQPIK
jgi:protocatechuate 3,4-dioxygenase beta subunit